MLEGCQDLPQIYKRPIPALLYEDDAVIMAQTPLELQRALNKYNEHMKSLDLKINVTKTYIMNCVRDGRNQRTIFIENKKVENTKIYPYLGILIDNKGTWQQAIKARKLLFMRTTTALVNFSQEMGKRPPMELIKIYQAKCVSTAIYRAGIWGYCNVSEIQRVQNVFLRYLLAVPCSTSTYICHTELGLQYNTDIIRVQPLLLWH